MPIKPLHILLVATISLIGLATVATAQASDKPAFEKLAGEWVLEKVNEKQVEANVLAKFIFKDIDTLEIVVAVDNEVKQQYQTEYEATEDGKLTIILDDEKREGTWELLKDGSLYMLSVADGQKESLTMRRPKSE